MKIVGDVLEFLRTFRLLKNFGDVDYTVVVFLFVSVVLAGAASFASGRAVALGWKPVRLCVVYGCLIALAAAFMHYALFQQSVIPLGELWAHASQISQEPAASVAGLATNLAGFLLEFALQTFFAMAGFITARRAQMARQYGFARRKSTA